MHIHGIKLVRSQPKKLNPKTSHRSFRISDMWHLRVGVRRCIRHIGHQRNWVVILPKLQIEKIRSKYSKRKQHNAKGSCTRLIIWIMSCSRVRSKTAEHSCCDHIHSTLYHYHFVYYLWQLECHRQLCLVHSHHNFTKIYILYFFIYMQYYSPSLPVETAIELIFISSMILMPKQSLTNFL